MTSNLKYTKNYTEFGEPYQLVLPLSLEGLVSDDDSVRLLSHELEGLDYSLLYQAYSAKGRNPAVAPKTMFKILTTAPLPASVRGFWQMPVRIFSIRW